MDWADPCAERCRARCYGPSAASACSPTKGRRAGHVGRRRGVAQRDAAALSRVDHEVAQLLRRELVGVDGRQDRNLAQRGRPQPVDLVGEGFHEVIEVGVGSLSTASQRVAVFETALAGMDRRGHVPHALGACRTGHRAGHQRPGERVVYARSSPRFSRRPTICSTSDSRISTTTHWRNRSSAAKEIWSANGLSMSATPARRIAERLVERCVRSRFGLVDTAVPEGAQF